MMGGTEEEGRKLLMYLKILDVDCVNNLCSKFDLAEIMREKDEIQGLDF